MSEKKPKFSRRTSALIWCIAVGFVIAVLIYLEQIALLYVIATLALVSLLLIVGFSDLRSVDRESMKDFAKPQD